MTAVLVSGASVAGTTLAYWLAQHGFSVTVVERHPGLRPGGQAVDVRGPALEVLDRMGLLAAAAGPQDEHSRLLHRRPRRQRAVPRHRIDTHRRSHRQPRHRVVARRLGRIALRGNPTQHRIPIRRQHRRDGQPRPLRRRDVRERARAQLRPGHRRRRPALQCAGAGLRPRGAIHQEAGDVRGDFHRAQLLGPRPLADVALRRHQHGRGVQRAQQHRGPGHVGLHGPRPATSTTATPRPSSPRWNGGWPTTAGCVRNC